MELVQHAQTGHNALRGPYRVVPRSRRWMPRVLRPGSPLADRINETVAGALDPARIARLHALGGWLRIEEGMTLFHFAYRPTRRGRVVEIGTFLGKSTAWMATALQRAGAADRIVAVDPHQRLQAIEDVYDVREHQEQAQRTAALLGVPPEEITTRELFLDNMASLPMLCPPRRGCW